MDRDIVTRQVDGTGRENDLLDLALGYQQMLSRIERAAQQRVKEPQAPNETIVLALMGVLSLKTNLDRWLRASDRPTDASQGQETILPESILR